jgi:NADP-dependent 3-hydroxy acid dehydrogenase YdfG
MRVAASLNVGESTATRKILSISIRFSIVRSRSRKWNSQIRTLPFPDQNIHRKLASINFLHFWRNEMSNGIQGKVVVITGASSGLGEATARHLAKLGAKVVLGARRQERMDVIVQDIKAIGGDASAYTVDVTRREEVAVLVDNAVRDFGRVDVMINNAGLMAIAPMSELRVDEWDRMIDINVKGVLYGIAAALPKFEAQGSGHFINISSSTAAPNTPFAPSPMACVTKSAARSAPRPSNPAP